MILDHVRYTSCVAVVGSGQVIVLERFVWKKQVIVEGDPR